MSAHSHAPKPQGPQLAGVLGFFDDPESILAGMKQVRDAKYRAYDAFTPFPVHGMDDAQGLKRSLLPYVAFCAGITGCIVGFGLQYWTSVIDWPINVGGKPMNSWPAFVPVMFELTILFTGISTVFGMFFFNRLPNITRKIFDPAITRDRFALYIEAPQSEGDRKIEDKGSVKKFDEAEAMSFLQKAGAKDVRKVFNEGWF